MLKRLSTSMGFGEAESLAVSLGGPEDSSESNTQSLANGEATANGKSKGKGKGKGKGGGPPPPKVTGQSPLRKSKAPLCILQPQTFFAAIGPLQEEDGSFEPSRCAALFLENASVLERLSSEDSSFCTRLLLELCDAYSKKLSPTAVEDFDKKMEQVDPDLRSTFDRPVDVENLAWRPRAREFSSSALAARAATEDAEADAAVRAFIEERLQFHIATTRKTKPSIGVSDAVRQEKELAMQKKSAEERETQAKLWKHWRSLKPCSVNEVPWSTVVQTMWVQGDSGGVILVELQGGVAICVKPQDPGHDQAIGEYVAERVATLLDVRVPEFRLVHRSTAEYRELGQALMAAPTATSGHEASIAHIVTLGLEQVQQDTKRGSQLWQFFGFGGEELLKGRQFLGVLEFVPGFVLMGPEAHAALEEANTSSSSSSAAAPPTLLLSLGRLCALDVLVNNRNRMPLPIWNNGGNLSNIIVRGDEVVGVDQQVHCVQPLDSNHYYNSLRGFIDDIVVEGRKGQPPAPKAKAMIQQALRANCGTELKDPALDAIVLGIVQGLERAAELSRSGELAEQLERIALEASEQYRQIASEQGKARIEMLCSFVGKVAEEANTSLEAAALVVPEVSFMEHMSFITCCRGRPPTSSTVDKSPNGLNGNIALSGATA